MSTVIRATQLIGRPVVTLDAADDVAEVKDIVFDPGQAAVIGFALRARGALGAPAVGHLPIGAVASIGHDAIMIAGGSVIDERSEEIETARKESRDVLGNEVLTESGTRIGTVVDLILRIEGSSASVAGYEIVAPDQTHALIPIPATLAISGQTLMVPDATERYVADDLTGFGAAIDAFRLAPHRGAR